jgi:hypothetical protein
MNPLTGGAHYVELGLKDSKSYASAQNFPSAQRTRIVPSVPFDYNSSFAAEERLRRQSAIGKKEQRLMKRREDNLLREAGRWQAMESDYQRSLQNLADKRAGWKAGQKNIPSEAYNVLTLEYDNNALGERLKLQDDKKKFREGLRMFQLDSKMNSGFNVITGAARQPPINYRF